MIEPTNGLARHRTVEKVAQQACQAANQADTDCMHIAQALEEARAENAVIRDRLAHAEKFIGEVLLGRRAPIELRNDSLLGWRE